MIYFKNSSETSRTCLFVLEYIGVYHQTCSTEGKEVKCGRYEVKGEMISSSIIDETLTFLRFVLQG